MSEWVEIFKLVTLATIIPFAIFTMNWAWRYEKGYSQSAAADFILGMLIFDSTAVVAGTEFAPFLRSTELVPIITYWHFVIGFLSWLVWIGIIRWGEPVIEQYYRGRIPGPLSRRPFPILQFLACWVAVSILVSLHIGFFTVKHIGPEHHV